MKVKILNLILLGLNVLSIIAGVLGFLMVIPGEIGAIGVVVYASSDKLRKFLVTLGDKLDDGEVNGSFSDPNETIEPKEPDEN